MLQDITNTVNQRSDELGEQLNATMKANFMEAYKLINENHSNENTPPTPAPQALAMQSPNAEIMTMIATMQTKMDALTARLASTNLGIPLAESIAADATINPKTGRAFKRYCWSYGCCVHWGRHCTVKKRGHKDDASFKDRKGGSDKDCMPNRS